MSIGPVELIIVKFPGNQLRGGFGELVPALRDVVESNTVRVIDLVIVRKDADGKTEAIELTSLDEDQFTVFKSLVDEVLRLISADQIQRLSDMLDNNSAGAIMLFENVWATRFRDSLLAAKGELVAIERVPKSVIDSHRGPTIVLDGLLAASTVATITDIAKRVAGRSGPSIPPIAALDKWPASRQARQAGRLARTTACPSGPRPDWRYPR
jgi:hypothetical protein